MTARKQKRAHVDGLLRIRFLNHADGRVGDENEENDEGFNECTPPS